MLLPIYFFFASHLWVWEFLSTFVPAKKRGAIAQLVEQRTENPCVPGSIPGGTTKNDLGFCLSRSFVRKNRLSRKSVGITFSVELHSISYFIEWSINALLYHTLIFLLVKSITTAFFCP